MIHKKIIPVAVTAIRELTPLIKEFTLTAQDGVKLPPISGGGHTVVVMPDADKPHKNPYSLVATSDDQSSYTIAVRREEMGRGGSIYMHDQVKVGSELQISTPANLFPIYKLAKKHLLVAGGIGITPFMAYLKDLPFLDGTLELHYSVRSLEHAAFLDELKDVMNDGLFVYAGEREDERVNLHKLLADQPLGTHVYVCGPTGMVDAVLKAAEELGWPSGAVHYEVFKAPETGNPFMVQLRESGKTVKVGANETLLEALENQGLEIDYSCRGGACGLCKTTVLDGDVEHRDFYLTDEEKSSNKLIMPCVSRCKSDLLALDL